MLLANHSFSIPVISSPWQRKDQQTTMQQQSSLFWIVQYGLLSCYYPWVTTRAPFRILVGNNLSSYRRTSFYPLLFVRCKMLLLSLPQDYNCALCRWTYWIPLNRLLACPNIINLRSLAPLIHLPVFRTVVFLSSLAQPVRYTTVPMSELSSRYVCAKLRLQQVLTCWRYPQQWLKNMQKYTTWQISKTQITSCSSPIVNAILLFFLSEIWNCFGSAHHWPPTVPWNLPSCAQKEG